MSAAKSTDALVDFAALIHPTPAAFHLFLHSSAQHRPRRDRPMTKKI